MKNRLDVIRALYGEAEVPEQLRSDAEFRQEYEALSAVKDLLDDRVRERPDADVLARVFAAAAPAGHRMDRRPVPARSARFRALWASSAATAIVALLAVSLWQIGLEPVGIGQETLPPAPIAGVPGGEGEAIAGAAEMAEQALGGHDGDPALRTGRSPGAATPERAYDAVAGADGGLAAAAREPASDSAAREEQAAGAALVKRSLASAGAPQSNVLARNETAGGGLERSMTGRQQSALLVEGLSVPDSALLWDAAGDLLEVHRTIERLQAGVELMWDEPVVPLELLRTGSPSRGLHEAGQRQ